MDEYYSFAQDIASKAGVIMKQYFGLSVAYETKKDTTPVTIADTTINSMVIEAVKRTFPEHGIIGEEESYNPDASYVWVVDPIDGTLPFTKGVPTNLFSLALVVDGEPVIGILYDPYLDRMFRAQKGKGAYVNKTLLTIPQVRTAGYITVDIEGRSLLESFDVETQMMQQTIRMTKLYCITYPLALIATGQYDIVVFGHGTVWDVAAAKVIIEEAGGVTSDLVGNDQPYNKPINGFVAAVNKELHDAALARVILR